MADVDIPFVDESIVRQPLELREDLAALGRSNLYFFAKGVMGYKDMTERCHGPLAAFADQQVKQFLMMLIPRDHFKTSLITIAGGMQRVVKNQESRQLIANESATNSERFLRSIRQHAESNKVFRGLYSEVIPLDYRKVRWNDSELDFRREGKYPEPTIDSIGMTGASTSRHYTHITVDDPISEEAVKSEKVMQDTITRLSGFTALLSKPLEDTIWIVGTRWALWDCYQWFIEKFGDRMGKYFRSVIDPFDGELIFPELISHDLLALKREVLGDYRFSCLYMNNPRNIEVQDLNTEDLRYYSWVDDQTIQLVDAKGSTLRRVRIDQLQIYVTVDLAPAETASSDRNAVCTVGITPWNEVVVLDMFAQRCTPLVLMEHLFTLKQRYGPFKLGIEDIAYQKAFKYFLKGEAERRGEYFRVVPLKNQGNTKKTIKIRGLQPVMATGRLYIDPKMTLLRNEMSEFPLGKHDDCIDALAMQLEMWPQRLSPEHWAKLEGTKKKLLRFRSLDDDDIRKRFNLDPDEEIHREDLMLESGFSEASLPRTNLITGHRTVPRT